MWADLHIFTLMWGLLSLAPLSKVDASWSTYHWMLWRSVAQTSEHMHCMLSPYEPVASISWWENLWMVETYFAQIAFGAVVIEIPWRGIRWETEMVKSKWKAPELNHCPYRRSTSQKVPIVTTQLSNRCFTFTHGSSAVTHSGSTHPT